MIKEYPKVSKHKLLRKIFLICMVILIISLVITKISIYFYIEIAENSNLSCKISDLSGLCIEIIINSYSDELGMHKTELGYPSSFRQGDFLRIDEIKIYNKDKTSYLLESISLDTYPVGGHTISKNYPPRYGNIEITINKTISQKNTYLIKREEYNEYVHILNSEPLKFHYMRGIELYKTGEWVIDYSIKHNSSGYTILKNGRWEGNVFLVNPRHEIDSLIESKRAIEVAIFTLVFISLLTIFQTWKKEIEQVLEVIKC